jgi:hypothetical protein
MRAEEEAGQPSVQYEVWVATLPLATFRPDPILLLFIAGRDCVFSPALRHCTHLPPEHRAGKPPIEVERAELLQRSYYPSYSYST